MNNNQTLTSADVENLTGIAIPPHLDAQAAIPVLKRDVPNEQGDVLIWLRPNGFPGLETGQPMDGEGGVKVVEGEADRNSHILNSTGPESTFARATPTSQFDYGVLTVAEGETVLLTHTGEHYASQIPSGVWLLRGQKDAATMRRVAD